MEFDVEVKTLEIIRESLPLEPGSNENVLLRVVLSGSAQAGAPKVLTEEYGAEAPVDC